MFDNLITFFTNNYPSAANKAKRDARAAAGMPAALEPMLAQVAAAKHKKRSFDSAAQNRVNSFWAQSQLTSNAEVLKSLQTLRARSRDLFRNSDYAKKFQRLLRQNVIGPAGIVMQNKARESSGALDAYANTAIQAAWNLFVKKENFDVSGRLSKINAEKLVITTVAIDGESFVRKVANFPNSVSKFAIQFIDADRIPLHLNDAHQQIFAGIKFDEWGRPLGYYVSKRQENPLLVNPASLASFQDCDYVPAAEMLHLFVHDFPGQLRGVPWAHTALLRLGQLGEFEKAELVAAIMGASQAGFFEKTDAEALAPGEDSEDSDYGGFSYELQPGMLTALPPGVTFKPYSPTAPTGNVLPFVKTQLRGAASGLGISYTSMSNDMEGVSYSTARTAMLDEREFYKELQSMLIEDFCQPIYDAWLDSVLLRNLAGSLPYAKLAKFSAAVWRPRGFMWIDPKTEVDANAQAVKSGFKSFSDVLAEQGRDVEETFRAIAEERALADSLGLLLETIVVPGYVVPIPNNQQQQAGDGTAP